MNNIDNINSAPAYQVIGVIGEGMFGKVIKAVDKNKTVVAIKRVYKYGCEIGREAEILILLRECPYIVKLIDIFFTKQKEKKKNDKIIQNFVFEFIPKNLFSFISSLKKKKTHIEITKIKSISHQILLGLKFCHDRKIVHRDLKPENILLTDDDDVKICDFGSAKIIKKKEINSSTSIGSLNYRSPELIFGKSNYDSKVDIFAAGLIIGELFTLEPLFFGKNEVMQIMEYINVLGIPEEKYLEQFQLLSKEYINYLKEYKINKIFPLNEILNADKAYTTEDINDACELLLGMLKWDFNERLSVKQCLDHKFFKSK